MLKKLLSVISVLVLCLVSILVIDQYVKVKGNSHFITPEECPPTQAAIVLGAYVSPEGRLCDMLTDRVKTAVELYKADKVDKIIMTGDHGRTNYDEVNHMRFYAENLGVPTEDIFMDHAGFCTYDSMYRAKNIFLVDSAVIVTQAFHLPRAVYTARALGINAVGIKADKHIYAGTEYYNLREIPARLKTFIQVVTHSKPRFLGDTIPVTGDGRKTHDNFTPAGKMPQKN